MSIFILVNHLKMKIKLIASNNRTTKIIATKCVGSFDEVNCSMKALYKLSRVTLVANYVDNTL